MTDVEARIVSSATWEAPASARPPTPLGRCAGTLTSVADAALDVGLRRVQLLAWRDLDDPEAGGSELHAHEIATHWGEAGLDVTLRTSAVPGATAAARRPGYRAVRRGGRYGVFPRSALDALMAGRQRPDGLVEIWNGMPFFSPVWRRGARVVFLHHVHGEMWRMVMSRSLGRVGELVERRVAPPFYRHTRVVTLSDSARREIQSVLGLTDVAVVPPGVDGRFTSGPGRAKVPTVLAVGRLVPVKRFPLLVEVLGAVRRRVPDLQAVIVGEGYARAEVEEAVRRADAAHWLTLTGHCPADDLLAWYRRAWVLTSASQREGWGMTITEAGACATPAVVTRIPGHQDAVTDGVSGLLAGTPQELADGITSVLLDRVLRQRLGRGAAARAAGLNWQATAAGTLSVLLGEYRRTAGAARAAPAPGSRPRPTPVPAR